MRFHDKVGYGVSQDLGGGVWSDDITERTYTGDVSSVMRSIESEDKVNADIRLQNQISIVADAFALENFADIKYVSWKGSLWTVLSVEVERPRLVLSLGGIWNGQVPQAEVP